MINLPPINLEYLNQVSEGDQDFESELIALFIDDANQHIQAAEMAAASRNFKALEREAHHLKGSSGNVGAQVMQSIASELEQAALQLSYESVADQILELKTGLAAVVEFTSSMIS